MTKKTSIFWFGLIGSFFIGFSLTGLFGLDGLILAIGIILLQGSLK